MNVFGLTVIRNEADVIEFTLRRALAWCTEIFVFDTGSDDDTWEVCRRLADETGRIIAYKSQDTPFREGLRGELFVQYSHRARPGDWWCRLDGDEVYWQSPLDTLCTVPKSEHVVWARFAEYYPTRHEIDARREMGETYWKVRSLNDLPHCYSVGSSEPRFFRHRPRLSWDPKDSWPRHMGIAHSRYLVLQHFKYRSPEQIQKRIDTRRSTGTEFWWHTGPQTWTDVVADRRDLRFDHRDGTALLVDEELRCPVERLERRVIKRILHGLHIWP